MGKFLRTQGCRRRDGYSGTAGKGSLGEVFPTMTSMVASAAVVADALLLLAFRVWRLERRE
ncbi:MAG: hypothetical protein OEL91_04870 [Burkholderiaceae bacterium]|nr:hypothetical protein [Burkholderiaceae bacterium]